MSTCLLDAEFYPEITTMQNMAEQLRKIAGDLESGDHHAMILHVGNYQVLVDWITAEFIVIG